MLEKDYYYFWLSQIEGVGFKTMQQIVGQVDSVDSLYESSELCQKLKGIKLEIIQRMENETFKKKTIKMWKEMNAKNTDYRSYWSENFPSMLRTIYSPPKELYVRGHMMKEDEMAIAIVGARECTYYGRDMARWFGFRLAKAGIWVVSGLAKGIDGWAHQGALEAEGKTCAVLGCGVDRCYPEEHYQLYQSIVKQGAVISEYAMGTKARAGFFPLRNRIISGLSNGVLVVEARHHSGSLITATQALEQGKDVFVIPGRIGDKLSEGCNELIRAGAIPVFHPNDILEFYNLSYCDECRFFSKEEDKIWNYLSEEPIGIYELGKETSLPVNTILNVLIEWKKKKMIQEVSQGYFIKV